MDRSERLARIALVPTTLALAILLYRDVSPPAREGTQASRLELSSPVPTSIGSEGAAPSATAPSMPTSSLQPDGGVGPTLAPADPAAPPVAPEGTYREGRVLLRGSVGDRAVAESFLRRFTGALGAANVEVAMQLDPRVSATTLDLHVDEPIAFSVARRDLDDELGGVLALARVLMGAMPEATMIVTGHAGGNGDEATRTALSRAGARLAVEWLVERGIDPERISSRGVGTATVEAGAEPRLEIDFQGIAA